MDGMGFMGLCQYAFVLGTESAFRCYPKVGLGWHMTPVSASEYHKQTVRHVCATPKQARLDPATGKTGRIQLVGEVNWGGVGQREGGPVSKPAQREGWRQDREFVLDPNSHPQPIWSYVGCSELCQQFGCHSSK